ncbi:MAG: RCC1 domain-containing protein [Egibacteraceae bacterium]
MTVVRGANESGPLGDATTVERTTPVVVDGLDDAVALAAGSLHTCALREGGSVAWGATCSASSGTAPAPIAPRRQT